MCHIHTADVGLYLEIKGELYKEIIQTNLGHENHVSITHAVFSTIPEVMAKENYFVYQSRASLVGYHVLYSWDLSVQFRGDIVRRN